MEKGFKAFPKTFFKRGQKWVAAPINAVRHKGFAGGNYKFDPIRVDLDGVIECYGLGDSLMAGSFATSTPNRYLNKFCAVNDIATLHNNAVGGRGIWRAHKEIAVVGYTRAQTLLLVEAGLNDMKRAGLNDKTFNKVENNTRCLIHKQLVLTSVAAGSASVTRTGSHSPFDARGFGGYWPSGTLPGNFASFPTGGGAGSWSYTFTLSATDRGIGVMFSTADGTTVTGYGTATIAIDGVFVANVTLMGECDGISDGADANTRGPIVYSFYDLGPGSHTILVTSNADGFVPCDSFNVMGSVAQSGPIIFCELPYCDSNGYRSTGAASGTRKFSQLYSKTIYDIVVEHVANGWIKTGFAPLNTYLNINSGMDPDGTHWNDLNNDLAVKAINKAIYKKPTWF